MIMNIVILLFGINILDTPMRVEENQQDRLDANNDSVLDEVIGRIFKIIDVYDNEYQARDLKNMFAEYVDKGLIEELRRITSQGQ